jgi:hypothetical protein
MFDFRPEDRRGVIISVGISLAVLFVVALVRTL